MNARTTYVLLACGVALLLDASLGAQCQRVWEPAPLPGANDKVLCSVEWDPDGAGPEPAHLVVGGAFTVIGSTFARGIAIYDDSTGQWSPLGGGVQGDVQSLLVMPNGDLIAGGAFAIAGGAVVNNIARWNGAVWSELGGGCDGFVNAMLVMPNGDLVAGGSFANAGGNPVNSVARWNGTSWYPFLTGISSATVRALALTSNGDLIAVGSFNGSVKIWDGASWSMLGGGFTGTGYCLRALPGGQLLVGGTIYSIGGTYMGNITRWNGTSWQALGTGFNNPVYAVDLLPNGDYLAGGSFSLSGSTLLRAVARWDGASWGAMATGLNTEVDTFCQRANGTIVAGGRFVPNGAAGGLHIAQWTGSSSDPFGSGCDGDVLRMRGDGEEVLIAGNFSRVAGIGADRVARWDGGAWSPLPGLSSAPAGLDRAANGDIVALGSFPDGSGSYMALKKWDGAAWSDWLGSSVVGSGARAMAVMPNGDIVVAGAFSSIGGVLVSNIARWDGVAWSPLGTGITGYVNAMMVEANGNLLVGGLISAAGGVPVTSLARWDGATWSALSGYFGEVRGMARSPSGTIVVGGAGVAAQVNGSTMQSLSTGILTGTANALAFMPDGSLLVGGVLTLTGVGPISTARWNGSTWSPFLGVNEGYVEGLAVTPTGTVWAGGSFISQSTGVLGYVTRSVAPCPAHIASYGAGCVGSSGLLQTTASALPWLGSNYIATTTGMPATSIGVCVRGFQPTLQQLWQLLPLGQPGCSLLAWPSSLQLQLPIGGAITTTLAVPVSMALVGANIEEQMLVLELDQTGAITHITSSNGMLLTVGTM